jgi:hypothetical protein
LKHQGAPAAGFVIAIGGITVWNSDQSEPLVSFSRFRLSIALRSIASVQRTAQSVFSSALDARIWKADRWGGRGESCLN